MITQARLEKCGAASLPIWRRRRDSNPRDPFEPNGFQDRRFQPLTHSSVFNSNVFCELAASLLQWRFELLHFGAEGVAKAGVKPTKVNKIQHNRKGRYFAGRKRIWLDFSKITNSRLTFFQKPLGFDRSPTHSVSRFEVQLDQVLRARVTGRMCVTDFQSTLRLQRSCKPLSGHD
jgi:hypothetical protein